MKTDLDPKKIAGLVSPSPPSLAAYIAASDGWELLAVDCQRPHLSTASGKSASWKVGQWPAADWQCVRWIWDGPEPTYQRYLCPAIAPAERMISFCVDGLGGENTRNYACFRLDESEWERISSQFEDQEVAA